MQCERCCKMMQLSLAPGRADCLFFWLFICCIMFCLFDLLISFYCLFLFVYIFLFVIHSSVSLCISSVCFWFIPLACLLKSVCMFDCLLIYCFLFFVCLYVSQGRSLGEFNGGVCFLSFFFVCSFCCCCWPYIQLGPRVALRRKYLLLLSSFLFPFLFSAFSFFSPIPFLLLFLIFRFLLFFSFSSSLASSFLFLLLTLFASHRAITEAKQTDKWQRNDSVHGLCRQKNKQNKHMERHANRVIRN